MANRTEDVANKGKMPQLVVKFLDLAINSPKKLTKKIGQKDRPKRSAKKMGREIEKIDQKIG